MVSDLITLSILFVIFLVIKYVGIPFKSSFLCDDFSINMPKKESTVPNNLLVLISFAFPIVFILLTQAAKAVFEKYIAKTRDNQSTPYTIRLSASRKRPVPRPLGDLYFNLVAFLFGCLVTVDLTDLAKVVVGRLRPNFLDVCKPEVDPYQLCKEKGLTSLRPGFDFKCLEPDSVVNESRLSFPSGHSSLSLYSMIFLILFIRHSWPRYKLGLIPYLVQALLFSLGMFVALSRVPDNKHHPTDVLAGSLLGTIVSIVTFLVLIRRRLFLANNYTSVDTSEEGTTDLNNNRSNMAVLRQVNETDSSSYGMRNSGASSQRSSQTQIRANRIQEF